MSRQWYVCCMTGVYVLSDPVYRCHTASQKMSRYTIKYCAFYAYSRSNFPGSLMVSDKMRFQFLKKRENFLATKSLKTGLDISAKSDLTM
jgi:hypothetical protein